VINVADGVETIPNWVPWAVAKVAPHLPRPAPHLPGPLPRLLCDDRMKAVWPELRKRAPSDVASKLKEHERRLLGLLNEDVSVPEQACAAFFISVARTIWNPGGRAVWTKAEAKKQAVRWEDAAALCRYIASEPMFPEHQVAAKEMADFFQTHANSLRGRGYLANLDQQIEPFVLGRSSHSPGYRGGGGDDQVRGYTRAIAADAERIFGSFLYGTVATVVSVALQKKVSAKSVENWCVGLPLSTPRS
jgi:hypothetical protein